MLDESTTTDEQHTETTGAEGSADSGETPSRSPRRRRAASRPAGPPEAATPETAGPDSAETPVSAPTGDGESANADKPARKRTAKKGASTSKTTAKKATTKKATAKKTSAKKAAAKKTSAKKATSTGDAAETTPDAAAADGPADADQGTGLFAPIFKAPDPKVSAKSRDRDDSDKDKDKADNRKPAADDDEADADDAGSDGAQRRRRRRGGRRRRKPAGGSGDGDDSTDADEASDSSDGSDTASGDAGAGSQEDGDGAAPGTRRRRRRRRRGEDIETSPDDPENTVVRVREPRGAEDEITALEGSTRMEAKKQRRREGRAAGRRRAPIVSEAEFLARRESVKREMVVRQRDDVTQIAVLEDSVLVEHYVARESQTSLIGNVYLGRVQNVLPSMEAAFIDIGKGRNAVLYAGEVDWNALGMEGKPHRIEDALKSGQTVLVQVTKDPVGHKGARLTGQISLPGRFLVYVPGGHTSGISRKLPDTERTRLKDVLKQVLPDDAGVIVRTAAEGATEEQLNRDVTALTARWDDIGNKTDSNQAPQLLYAEPDLMLKVVRDLFNEDFNSLVIDGADAWDTIEAYVNHVAPDLADRVHRPTGDGESEATDAERKDVFADYRIDEQIAKALERKVWLPSGGSLVIDRTEAMTVIDVNTGKFTGSGGNLEETVTKNNLEAAEEVVRQLRLRDIGGIIVIDFIDMVLESNRDLVLRRLVECLGRDRTRHQVAEVTSLGLVQMTRKRIGTGLLEAFSEACEHCKGRGVILHQEPIEPKPTSDGGSSRRRGKRGGSGSDAKSAKKSSSRRKSGDGSSDKADKGDKPSGKSADKGDKSIGKDADKSSGKRADEPAASSDKQADAPESAKEPADASA
ncbi:MAG TPA: Rne/Rng family ribonuclease [Nocardioidaceae bacterium]|nr:Rne/Rng family ribonuclease [Nocardioidaceae bacterium]